MLAVTPVLAYKSRCFKVQHKRIDVFTSEGVILPFTSLQTTMSKNANQYIIRRSENVLLAT